MGNHGPFHEFWARYLRAAAGPGAAIAHYRAGADLDVRAVLPAVRAPSLVLHREGDAVVPIEAGRAVARGIPDACFTALPGGDHLPFVGDSEALLEEVRRFLSQAARPAEPGPQSVPLLAAVVAFAERGGSHIDDAVRIACEREIARFRGVELCGLEHGRAAAMFDGPGRAMRFARATLARARALGIELAAGVSFDTCRFGEADIDGEAVRLAPRIAAQATPGEVLVSDPVRALLGGAIQLAPRGELPGDGTPLHAAIAGE
jgi:class 3 adenylate cyclase